MTWLLALSSGAQAQSPRVLYTWEGTGDARGWVKAFGDNTLALESSTAGELTIRESSGAGFSSAISDDANIIAEGKAVIGGLDLTGLSSLEFDLGHSGAGPIGVQFFVQATPGFTFIGLGPEVLVEPGVATYSAPLDGLTAEQIAYIRTIGVFFSTHEEEGDVTWTLREVRSSGEPLTERVFASHNPGTPDNGLQGAIVNFDNAALLGNDGGQNQTGLRHNPDNVPEGNSGSLRWTDLASGNGAAVTWGNGTVFQGNTFNERPTDMSNYARLVLRIAATNPGEPTVESVGVQYFLQSGGFIFHQAGSIETLPADGRFHELTFDISSVPDLDFVEQHGINLQAHAGGDLVIDVDEIRAEAAPSIVDCNQNGKDDGRDLVDGTSRDCNLNLIPDECDIARQSSLDCNRTGIPDECEVGGDEVSRVLYTWGGVGDPRSWIKNFGANEVTLENNLDGELTVTETGADGATVAISDGFTEITDSAPSTGGLDLLGMSALEFDIEHDGGGPVAVQFFVQATPEFRYVALGPDVQVGPDPTTYVLPLGGLSPAAATYIRTIGLNIRDHAELGNITWTLREVRAVGVPLSQRDIATHEPGSSDAGLQGAVVAFDGVAIEGNDGSSNQSGLRHNIAAPPSGNTGSLQWTDLPGAGGGAVVWFNGTVFAADTFNERPVDLSPYTEIVLRIAATNIDEGAVESLDAIYFLETGGFNRQDAGPPQTLPADGQYHELVFPIAAIPDLAYVDAHGVDLQEHIGPLLIDVDSVRARSRAPTRADCNGNGVPDACDIEAGRLTDADQDGVPDECEDGGEGIFRRGDSNADGRVDISDAVYSLGFLFSGGAAPLCRDAADGNDDQKLDISDAVYTLNHLFSGGPALPPPGRETCGPDPTADELEECAYPPELCGEA
jgi:hypothetical protein